MSPHPVLTAAITQTLDEHGTAPSVVTGTLRRDDGGPAPVPGLPGRSVRARRAGDWAAVLPGGAAGGPAHLRLPAAALLAAACPPAGDLSSAGRRVGHPLLGARWSWPGGGGPHRAAVGCGTQPWLAEHAVAGTVLLPGTAFLEMAVHAGDAAGCGRLEELTLEAPLLLPADGRGPGPGRAGRSGRDRAAGRCRCSRGPRTQATGSPWTRHASGLLAPAARPPGAGTDRGRVHGVAAAGSRPGRTGRPVSGLAAAASSTARPSRACGRPGGAGRMSSPRWRCPTMLPPTRARSVCIRPCSTPPCTRLGLVGRRGSRRRAGRGTDEVRLPFAWTGVSSARGGRVGAAGPAAAGGRRDSRWSRPTPPARRWYPWSRSSRVRWPRDS